MKIMNNLIEKIDNRIDSKLISYIDRYIDDSMGDIEKAIVIYLVLGDVLVYSPEYSIYYDYSILGKVKDINLDNNFIICRSWSLLYHRILKRYGIFSKVIKTGSHYRVELVKDGTFYSADATNYGGNRMYYGMSDLAKIKYGFRIERFHVTGIVDPYDCELLVKKHKELDNLIEEIYKKQGRKYISSDKVKLLTNKVLKKLDDNSSIVGEGTLKDVQFRMKMLNRFWRLNISEYAVEKIQLFNSFFFSIFEDESYYESNCYTVYDNSDGKIKSYKFIVFDSLEFGTIFYLDNGREFVQYNYKELIDEFRKRRLFMKEHTRVVGLEESFQEFRLRKSK